MTMPSYPLLEVLQVKIRRVEKQEKVVSEKRQAKEREEKKLKECEEARDKVLNHHKEKLKQLRDELDEGTTSDKVKQMKYYLEIVKEKLEVEEKKVEEQKEQVEIAQKELEEAQIELKRRRQDVDKIKTHREDWTKEMKKEMQILEGREEDELGQIIFLKKLRERH